MFIASSTIVRQNNEKIICFDKHRKTGRFKDRLVVIEKPRVLEFLGNEFEKHWQSQDSILAGSAKTILFVGRPQHSRSANYTHT